MRKFSTLVTLLIFFCCPLAAQAEGSAPPGFRLSHLNASVEPVTDDGVTTFKILPDDCSDVPYRPGDDESDCKMGSTKSQIYHEQMIKIGETVEYSFEILVDPAFDYPGAFRRGLESLPFAPGARDSDLRIAGWEGPERKSFVFMMKLDATRGITFQERVCAPPSAFGTWVKFTMKIRWEHNNKGWVHATCDDRTVWIEEGAASARQAVCHMFNECRPGIVPNSKSFNFTLGLAMSGRGDDWKETGFDSKFVEINPDGLMIRMRNISQRKGVELYGPDEKAQVKLLQEKLNQLGCEVGTPDGVVGPKTREQARLCRGFAEGEMPDALNVATLGTFVELYSRDGVADLPPGSLPVPPPYIIHVTGRPDQHPEGEDTIYSIASLIERPGRLEPLDFLLIGKFDQDAGIFEDLSILIETDIGKKSAASIAECGNNRVESLNGIYRPVLNYARTGNNLELSNADCVLEKLPEKARENVGFVIDHFREFATTLVEQQSVEAIENENVRQFIRKVAGGETKVYRGSIARKYVIQVHQERSLTSVASNDVGAYLVGRAERHPDMRDFDFVIKGTFKPDTEEFSDLLFHTSEPAPATFKSCEGATVFWEGSARFAIRFKKVGDQFISTNADCLMKHLTGDLRGLVSLLTGSFTDIAIGAVEGGVEKMSHPGLRLFLSRVARGEIIVSR